MHLGKGNKVSNMNDFTVKVSYRNKESADLREWTYDFKQYTEMMKRELMRIIMEVEDTIYHLQGSRSKDEWDSETMEHFQKIRHKLLDQANAIERLPQTLHYKGVSCASVNLGEYLASIIDAANAE